MSGLGQEGSRQGGALGEVGQAEPDDDTKEDGWDALENKLQTPGESGGAGVGRQERRTSHCHP